MRACVVLASILGMACGDRPPPVPGMDGGPTQNAGADGAFVTDAAVRFDASGDGSAPADADAPDAPLADGAIGRDGAVEADCPEDDLGSATGEGIAVGTLDLQGNEFRPSCAEVANGEDLAFAWTAPASGSWLFDTLGSEFDTVIAVFDGCEGSELACNDDTSEVVQSALRIELSAGQRVVVVVDEYGVLERGAFKLNVHRDVPTTESSCDDGVDEDRDGAKDCRDPDCSGAAGC